MYIILFIFLVLWSASGYSQSADCPCQKKNIGNAYVPNLIGKEFIDQHPGNLIQYHAYWKEADIYLVSGDSIKGEYVRYSSLLDEMLWMRKDDYQKAILDRRLIKEVVIHDDMGNIQKFIKVDYNKNMHLSNSYMQLLSNGKTRLLKQYITTELPSGEMFKKVNFFLFINGVYSGFSQKHSSFLKAFGEDKKQMKQIFRSNHLSVKKEADLIRAVEIYNSMP